MKPKSDLYSITRLIIIAMLVFLVYSQVSADDSSIGRVTFPLGDVYCMHAGEESWVEVQYNQDIYPNETIKTERESRCELTLTDGSVIRIGENTVFNLGNSSVSMEHKNIQAEVEKGKVWLNMRKVFAQDEKVELRTPTAVAAIRGTVYRSDVDTTRSDFRVYEGKIAVNLSPRVRKKVEELEDARPFQPPQRIDGPGRIEGPKKVTLKEWLEIVAGEQISIGNDGKYVKTKFDMEADAGLDWVKWNSERDSQRDR